MSHQPAYHGFRSCDRSRSSTYPYARSADSIHGRHHATVFASMRVATAVLCLGGGSLSGPLFGPCNGVFVPGVMLFAVVAEARPDP